MLDVKSLDVKINAEVNMNANERTCEVAPPEAVVRALYASLQHGESAGLERWLAPEIVLEVPGDSPNSGRYRGIDAFRAFMRSASARSGGTLRFTLHDVALGDEHVIALATYSAERPGKRPLENRLCHLLRVVEGQVVYSRFYTGDQYAVDAFWRD
jgi:uncharacterized protein